MFTRHATQLACWHHQANFKQWSRIRSSHQIQCVKDKQDEQLVPLFAEAIVRNRNARTSGAHSRRVYVSAVWHDYI